MYCTNCGTKLLENIKFCNTCGKQVISDTKDETVSVTSNELKYNVLRIAERFDRKLIVEIILLTLSLIIFITQNSSGDFRKASWGMTKDEVIKTEKKAGNVEFEEFGDGSRLAYYNIEIDGVKTDYVKYSFEKNLLVEAEYHVNYDLSYQGSNAANKILFDLKKEYGDYERKDYFGDSTDVDLIFSEDSRTEVVLNVYNSQSITVTYKDKKLGD